MSSFLRTSIWVAVLGTLLALGLYLGDRVKTDPGYVLFAYGGYAVEMSLWVFLIVLVVFTVVFWIVFGLGVRSDDSQLMSLGLGLEYATKKQIYV